MLLTAIYVQLLVLGLTLLWFGVSRRRSHRDLILKIVAIAVLLVGLWRGSVWLYPPYWGLGVIALAFLALAAHKWRQPVSENPRVSMPLRTLFSNLPILIIAPLGAYLGVQGFHGHGQNVEGLTIDLSPPFKTEQRACVMSGGLNSLVNQHNFGSDQPVDIGQTYGLDIIRLGPAGFRTTPGHRAAPQPDDILAYNMFDTQVYAPCTGLVVWAENGRPDLPIGGRDKDWTSGNGVTLACGDTHVKLAHMKLGSVLVADGDQVQAGQALGRIGNSGNTEEPHLHLHAETIIEPGNPWAHGKPVHMRFNNRLMARGDCF